MKTLAAYALLLFAVVSTGACGGGDKESIGAKTPTRDDVTTLAKRAIPTSSDAQLTAALLTASDFGDGWTREPPSTTATVADQIFCGEKVEGLHPTSNGTFTDADGRYLFVYQVFSKFTSQSGAEAAMAEIRNAGRGCSELVSTDGVRATTFEIEPADLPSFGRDSLAFRGTTHFAEALPLSEAYLVQIQYEETIMLLAIAIADAGSVGIEEVTGILEAADRRYRQVIPAD